MNKKMKKKLRLNKITIQRFDNHLGGDEQKTARGGSVNDPALATVTPVYCSPNPNG